MLVCPYCGKPVAEEFNVCCGEAGHAIPEAEYAASFSELDETVEDLKAAYALLFRSFGKLQSERDELAAALRDVLRMCDEIARADHENRCAYYGAGELGDIARAALAKLDGGS